MKKIRTIIIGILALFSLYTITGFFILPLVLTSVVPKNLSQALNRQASIEAFKVNPFSLFVEMKGLSISDTGGKEEFISARTVSINIESMSIFKRAIIIRELKVENPTIRIIRFPDNTYNFSDLLKGGK
jgi:uncharacterized protein involved in outer membrane biogenesis